MRTIETLRPALSGLGVAASLASGFLFVLADEADAQETRPAPQPGDQPIQLGPVKVEGTGAPSSNALQTDTDLNRLLDSLQSTPQTITVIPQVVIEQQQATTINQVLQYVPGITVSTGRQWRHHRRPIPHPWL
jgi:catecholate siderophore receptor